MKALGESIRAGAVAAVKTPQPESTTGTVYYISNDGDDANSGTSADTPWQSIENVNATTFEPGDMVLFEAGDSWQLEEPLHPLGSGTADAPIVIGAYGEGAKPCFDAKAVADDSNRAWVYGDVTKHSSDGLYGKLENKLKTVGRFAPEQGRAHFPQPSVCYKLLTNCKLSTFCP